MSNKCFGKPILDDLDAHKIYAKNQGQYDLCQAIDNNDVILVSGPAGSGKTFIAIANAIKLLKEDKYKFLKITRPILEADEELGFLPGSLEDKVDPYMRPLYDAINLFLPKTKIEDKTKLTKKQKNEIDSQTVINLRDNIELCPLAYMRGRTFNDSIVILDEAQNVTIKQMKMFLSRMGHNTKMIVTGDLDQIDLPVNLLSGFKHVLSIMDNVKNLAIINMKDTDIVRNSMVKDMLERYKER